MTPREDRGEAPLPAEEQKQVTGEFEAVRRSPGALDGSQLQAASTAATVRADDCGQARVTTGPAVEAGSELDGYYVYDAQAPRRRSRSQTGSRSPGSARPSKSAPCWNANDGRTSSAHGGSTLTHVAASGCLPGREPSAPDVALVAVKPC